MISFDTSAIAKLIIDEINNLVTELTLKYWIHLVVFVILFYSLVVASTCCGVCIGISCLNRRRRRDPVAV